MKNVYVVCDDLQNVVAVFDTKASANKLADILTEGGDAGYNGTDPICLPLNPSVPRGAAKCDDAYEVHVMPDGRIVKEEWIPPLKRQDDGTLVLQDRRTRFIGFFGDDEQDERPAMFIVSGNDNDNDWTDAKVKQFAAKILASGLWPKKVSDEQQRQDVNAALGLVDANR